MKTFIRAITVGTMLLVIVSGAAAQDGETQILDEIIVEPDNLIVTVTATGTIEPDTTANLAFELSAPVEEILVQEGDSVEQGEVLARLTIDDLEAALREAEIALELQRLAYEALIEPPRDVDIAAAEVAVAAAEAGIPAAGFGPTRQQIQIAEVQAELARNRLWQAQLNRDIIIDTPEEFVGRPRIQQAQAGVQQADFGVDIADANIAATRSSGGGLGAIASAEAQLVQAQVSLERLLRGPEDIELLRFEIQLDQAELAVEQARVAIDRAILAAPFDGVVAEMNLTEGEVPPQQLPAIQLIDEGSYYVELAIDESDVVNIQLGQPVSLRLDALPEATVTGVVSRLSITPDETAATVVYRARVLLDPTVEPIRVGMTTTATITTEELTDVVVLPNRFIRIDRDTQNAFVTIQNANGGFEEIQVELGERNNEFTQIISGLEVGQRVVQVPRETLGLGAVLGGPGN